MSRLVRTVQRFASSTSSSRGLNHVLRGHNLRISLAQSQPATSCLLQSRLYATTGKSTQSPTEANILRILNNEMEYQSEYAPPHQPATTFDSFTVEDQPGEQYMTIRGRFNDAEDIKLEVTMFDGYKVVPRTGDDSSGEDVILHISVLVGISKKDGAESLEYVCSAWPDGLEIQKVYLLTRNKVLARPYLGPEFRNLNRELQTKLREFLEERGVNNKLCGFLHNYMTNKDRIELINWLGKVKSFVEK